MGEQVLLQALYTSELQTVFNRYPLHTAIFLQVLLRLEED